MYIIAAFEQTIDIELALDSLEEAGIPRSSIMAVPLDRKPNAGPHVWLDSLHYSDGISSLDLSAIFGTCLMLLGAIYGFEWTWGPIIWGIIGAVSGIMLGYVLKIIFVKSKPKRQRSTAEIVLIVKSGGVSIESIEHILWRHHALGLSSVKATSPSFG